MALTESEADVAQENRVVTVTVNPAIDQTLSIPNFRAGAVNRVQSWRMDAGGKGINVASFLADFGQPATATGFLGADNDEIFRRLFQRKGIEDRCVRIAGQTRIGIKISDEVLNQTTDINFPGEAPSPDDVQRLFDILAELAATREWFVLSGSMPPGVSTSLYADMVRALRGKKVVLDTSGEGFARAVSAGPWLIKPNVDELREFVGQPLDSHAAILAAARRLSDRYGIASVVVSMGKQGALFVEGNDALWAVPPEVQVKSTVGAGDAMVAGIVAAKIRGLSLADGARLATAFSATAISHVGHDLTSIAEVEAMRDRVAIRDLS
ncbi:MAG: 1-phosphofructokinase [Anaerolineae bacterium]|nr:1-phosphofructokinase [Anaerolineae bacterium]